MKKKIIAVALTGLLCFGCSRERKEHVPASDADVKVRGDAGELMMKVDAHYRGGNLEGAIDTLGRALREEKYESDKGVLFAHLLNMLLDVGRVEEARARYLESVGTDEELARSGFNVLIDYYANSEDPDALTEWTEFLLGLPLPSDLAYAAFSSRFNALLARDSFSEVLELVPECIRRLNDDSCRRLFEGLFDPLVSSGKYSEASALLSAVEDVAADRAAIIAMVDMERVNMLFEQGRWIEAEKEFLNVSNRLRDEELTACLRRVAPVAMQKGQSEMLDRLCGAILKNQRGKSAARREAASQCIAIGRNSKDNAEVFRRMELLLEFELPPEEVFRFYSGYFYGINIMRDATKEELRQALRFGDRLGSLLTEAGAKDEMQSLLLDVSFAAEDYERSLKMLGDSRFSRDEQWRDMADNKIRAHMALRDGNKKEAIERFRKFMDYVATWETEEYDPSSGLSHTREMILGFNAARIGDILSSMGDEKGAAEAYKEAREYYEYALSEIPERKMEHAHVKSALEKLPNLQPAYQQETTGRAGETTAGEEKISGSSQDDERLEQEAEKQDRDTTDAGNLSE